MSSAVILWNDPGPAKAHDTGAGIDILAGAAKRDEASSDTLYFKFHIAPLSDQSTEEYFAAFELFEGDAERLGVGNAWKAWAYSAFVSTEGTDASNNVSAYIDLHSSRPENSSPGTFLTYELPRRGTERTIVFKIQYVAGGDDLVTVWLNPDLGPGANEVYQPETLTTRFNANASFDEVRLRHGGGGDGWIFSDMAIATAFSDFVDTSSSKPVGALTSVEPAAAPFNFHSWQREQGMPHSSIRAMTQTRDGYLWLGSDDGLTRFDGVRFVAFNAREALRGASVRALYGDHEGALWIGTGSGLVRYQAGQFATFGAQDGLPSEVVTSVAEDGQGRLWVGTESGPVIRQDGRFTPPDLNAQLTGKAVRALFRDGEGQIWLAVAGAGIYRSGTLVPTADSGVEELLLDPRSLLVDQNRRIWVGTATNIILCCDGGQWRRYRIPRRASTPYVTALAEEPDGTVWSGSAGEGLFQFKGGKLAAAATSSGLSDGMIEALMVDRRGKLWVSTGTALNQLRRRNLFAFGQDEGLGPGAVLGLAEVTPGVIWAAKPNDGLYRSEGGNFSKLTAAGLPVREPRMTALLVTRDGACWIACERGLLRFKDPQAVADESTLSGLGGLSITALAEDLGERIWAGTRDGALWQLANGNWSEAKKLSSPITSMAVDFEGALWVGTDGEGLYRLKSGALFHLDKHDGLLSDAIRTVYVGGTNTVWIGTADGGLSRWRGGQLVTFTTRHGLPENTISQILEDQSGHLWLGGNRGIACVNQRELEAIAAGRAGTAYPQLYGRADGMPSDECASGFSPAGLKTRSGLLWFSTIRGIAVADPRYPPTDFPAPTIVLEEALVDGLPSSQFTALGSSSETGPTNSHSQILKIPPGRHRFELQYTSLNCDAPEQVRFRYRLEGLDADWVDAGTRRTALYNYVPPGHYRFRLAACDSDGVWNEAGGSLAIMVARHFWQNGWVIGLTSVTLLVSVGAAVRLLEKRKLHNRLMRLEQEKALERERTRIPQDLHDEMGAKLCRISFLSENARRGDNMPAELQNHIASISDASREVLHSLDEIVWAVNPQNDTLEHMASYIAHYAEEYFQMTGIDCELDIPAQLPASPLSSQVRHHVFLAVHEAFTNILKHSGASRARVSLSCDTTTFEIRAADNGHGFDPNGHSTSASAEHRDGLHNMRQRLTEIGGQCHVDSQPGHGTTVRFVVPLTRHSQQN